MFLLMILSGCASIRMVSGGANPGEYYVLTQEKYTSNCFLLFWNCPQTVLFCDEGGCYPALTNKEALNYLQESNAFEQFD